MQVLVGGIPAYAAFSTCVWQYWHCSPSPSSWCLWLNGTGWSGRWPCRVTHGDRCSWSRVTPSAMTITPVNTRLNRASAFELRSKTCAMSAFLLPLHYLRLGVEKFPAMVGTSDYFARHRSPAVGKSALVYPEFSSLLISEYSSGKLRSKPHAATRNCFFTCDIRLSNSTARNLHNISCTAF